MRSAPPFWHVRPGHSPYLLDDLLHEAVSGHREVQTKRVYRLPARPQVEVRNRMKVQIMSPAADRVDHEVPPAPRLASLEGKTIGLYHNMTGGADVAVERVAAHLTQRFSNVTFERYGGDRRPGRPALGRAHHIDAEEAGRIATEVDAMIAATAH